MSEQSCLTCRWLLDPGEPHRYHECVFPIHVPSNIEIDKRLAVDTRHPWTECPCWQERESKEAR